MPKQPTTLPIDDLWQFLPDEIQYVVLSPKCDIFNLSSITGYSHKPFWGDDREWGLPVDITNPEFFYVDLSSLKIDTTGVEPHLSLTKRPKGK